VLRRIPPKVQGRVKISESDLSFIDEALQNVSRVGTMSWRLVGFPLDQVRVRAKTGSAEVYGKQSTSWVASYTKEYVVVMMVSQGGTGSGTSGPAIRKIWETLYGVRGSEVVRAKAAMPGATPPAGLPVFAEDGEILPPATAEPARGPKRAKKDRRDRS
jgi:penicillin-binding protein 2